MAWAVVLYRFWKHTAIFAAPFSATSISRSPWETLCASGFSTITLTPPVRKSMASEACSLCGVQMCATSGRIDFSKARWSEKPGTPNFSLATASRCGSVSQTATIVVSDMVSRASV